VEHPIAFKAIQIEICDSESEAGTELGCILGEEWTLKQDIEAFASILFEIMFGVPPQSDFSIPTGIPDFVSRIIESGLSRISGRSCSFDAILNILKQNDFEMSDGVDSTEVAAFVSWVESAEYLEN
jgi:hypothetical protein